MGLEDRPVLEPNAAGVDVGAREMSVAVPPARDENPVRVFAISSEDLERLTDWHECQWSQFLHSAGLFSTRAGHRRGAAALRHRNDLVSAASQHVQQVHQALTQMYLRIRLVINDSSGLTRLTIVDAIPCRRGSLFAGQTVRIREMRDNRFRLHSLRAIFCLGEFQSAVEVSIF